MKNKLSIVIAVLVLAAFALVAGAPAMISGQAVGVDGLVAINWNSKYDPAINWNS